MRPVRVTELPGLTQGVQEVPLYRCHGYASNGAPQRWVFVQPDDIHGNPITEGGNNVHELCNLAAGRCPSDTSQLWNLG